jgi:serine/threonine protein kinase
LATIARCRADQTVGSARITSAATTSSKCLAQAEWEPCGRHRLIERDVAIKVMRVERGGNDDRRARFAREARVTAALTSPHTIRVFDFGATITGELFYAMELLHGCDLEQLVRRFGPLPEDRAFYLLTQICDALAEAHERGLVHADIKPANLFACRMGLEGDFAKVLDFGLAQRENSSVPGMARSADGRAWATPAYTAPESLLGNAGIDRRTDVYALGCVVYFLLTGQLVFEADTPTDMVRQHLWSQPDPPSTKTECPISRDVDDLILACLSKDPARRPFGAVELKRQIACLRSGKWDQMAANRWWDAHLPECADPLIDDRVWISSPWLMKSGLAGLAVSGRVDTEARFHILGVFPHLSPLRKLSR